MSKTNLWVGKMTAEEKATWLQKRRERRKIPLSLEKQEARIKQLEERVKWESNPDAPHSWAEERRRRFNKRWENNQRAGYMRNYTLMRYYGITLEEYNRRLEEQNFKCALCLREHDPDGSHHDRLDVDHDHATDKVRGLLCQKCNKGIGLLGDSPEILQKAIEYLSKTKD
jgi:SNF2 family DNA or RNA helicase